MFPEFTVQSCKLLFTGSGQDWAGPVNRNYRQGPKSLGQLTPSEERARRGWNSKDLPKTEQTGQWAQQNEKAIKGKVAAPPVQGQQLKSTEQTSPQTMRQALEKFLSRKVLANFPDEQINALYKQYFP
jgi:hypothetical protein